MASPSRRSPRNLISEIRQEAHQFSFFQAVRLLGLAARNKRQGPLPAGLRFRTPASLSYPPSELVSYCETERHAPPLPDSAAPIEELVVSFMGLTGPSGVLPTAYTELMIERKQRMRDTGAHAFLDLFSHRAIALFYGAWRKYRYWIAVEAGEADGFTRNLLDFSGMGLSRLRQQMDQSQALDENLFIYYAGLLSQKPLSATTLTALVQGFFAVDAALEQFVGQWIAVPESEQSSIGQQACALGLSAFAGDRMWDRQTKMRLRLGPMRRAKFEALQPGSAGAEALKAMLQFALGHSLAIDVQLVLDQQDIPSPVVAQEQPLRLGGNLWIGAPDAHLTHPDDMRYSLLQ